ncbi:MAG: hypothetical protein AAB455_00420 [Patescibacteria group bacterium]
MIKQIAIHEGPHTDEIAALLLLRRFGGKKFPGVDKADVIFWSLGGDTPGEHTAANWLERGVLVIGQGYGQFDEHPCPSRGIPRKQDHCTCSLVARELGLPKGMPITRAVDWLVKQVKDQDLKGPSSFLAIESALSAMSRNGKTSSEMLEFGLTALDAILEDQIAFQEECDLALSQRGEDIYHERRAGAYKMIIVNSVSEHAPKAARCLLRADLVLRRDPVSEHLTIMVNREKNFPVAHLVGELRRAVAIETDPDNWDNGLAGAEGRLAGWYYNPNIGGGIITTGGNRVAAGVPFPSVINWLEVEKTAARFLGEISMEEAKVRRVGQPSLQPVG